MMHGSNSIALSESIISGDSLKLRGSQSQRLTSLRGLVINQSLNLNRVNNGNSVQLAKNISHLNNSLFIPSILTLGTGNIEMSRVVKVTASDKSMTYGDRPKNNRTPYLEFGHSLGSPIISGQLPNPSIFNQAANMQPGHNLSAEDIGMQNPMSDNRTLCVTISYSQTLQGSNTDSQNLHTSLRVAQTFRVSFSDTVNLRPSFSQSQKEKDSTANATLWDNANLRYEINQVVNLYYCSDDALALRWRRLISPDIAVTMNCAVLSPSSLNFSIESTSSCGTRASNFFDFAFTAFVAISASISIWWLTVYTKNIHKKRLTWLTLENNMVADTLSYSGSKNNNAPKCGNTIEASNHNVKEAYAMDTPQHNQTRLKFTFLIASGTQRLVDIHPVRLITVLADSENEARLLAGIPSLVFISRQPRDIGIDTPFNRSDMSTVQGVNHV